MRLQLKQRACLQGGRWSCACLLTTCILIHSQTFTQRNLKDVSWLCLNYQVPLSLWRSQHLRKTIVRALLCIGVWEFNWLLYLWFQLGVKCSGARWWGWPNVFEGSDPSHNARLPPTGVWLTAAHLQTLQPESWGPAGLQTGSDTAVTLEYLMLGELTDCGISYFLT